MPHLEHKKTPRTKAQQDLLLGALVGVSMLGITSVYALTLRYQDVGSHADDAPRWSVLTDGVITRTAPLKTTLIDVSEKIASITQAHYAQSRTIDAMKAKIAAGALSATTTPETETSAAAEAPADKP